MRISYWSSDVCSSDLFIDMHTHITHQNSGKNPIDERMTHSNIDTVLSATVYARNTLEAGFTSARDVGASTEVIVALNRAINEGRSEERRVGNEGVSQSRYGW